MKQKPRPIFPFVAFALLSTVLLSGCGDSPQPPDADTVAVFEGGRITRQEVKKTVDELLKAFGTTMELYISSLE